MPQVVRASLKCDPDQSSHFSSLASIYKYTSKIRSKLIWIWQKFHCMNLYLFLDQIFHFTVWTPKHSINIMNMLEIIAHLFLESIIYEKRIEFLWSFFHIDYNLCVAGTNRRLTFWYRSNLYLLWSIPLRFAHFCIWCVQWPFSFQYFARYVCNKIPTKTPNPWHTVQVYAWIGHIHPNSFAYSAVNQCIVLKIALAPNHIHCLYINIKSKIIFISISVFQHHINSSNLNHDICNVHCRRKLEIFCFKSTIFPPNNQIVCNYSYFKYST